jgi:hypothetical protein
MQSGFPFSVAEVRQMVRAKGGALACSMCGGERFTMEEVSVLASGHAEQYGTRHVRRAQLVCEDCGCVAMFDPSRLGTGRQVGSA